MAEEILQILVVEDDELDRRIIRKALRESGIIHELFTAEDHQQGKDATNGKEYDCIFLDYNLPGGTGLELLKSIRSSENTSPIIIVTSQHDAKIAAEAIKLGAQDYIPKNLISGDGIGQCLRFTIDKKKQAVRQKELENQLKETQKQLNTVVANAPVILFSLDSNAIFRIFEGKGLESIEIQKENIINQSLHEHNDLPITIENFKEAIIGNEHTVVEEWREKFFEIFYSPIRDENKFITGVLGIASDITEHKKAERELKHAKQLAEETAKIKEQFLANMSHEIRTPMNGIIGMTRILLNTKLNPEQNKFLESIQTCSDHLLVIIDDILDFSKIEAGKMSFESIPFSVDKLALLTMDLFQSKADEKSLQLTLERDFKIPPLLMGDPTRLSQILNNLVSNAIKFTENGEVRLKLKLVSSDQNCSSILFEIKDSGIGIPEKSLPTIFDSFTQASSDTTRKFGGTGLGLTIVKRLIELQNGEIKVKSKPGVGTTFSFELSFPEVKAEENNPANELGSRQAISHLRILIAEDNKVNQMVVKKLFSNWNAYIEIADNGLIALDMLRQSDFDIVLMDIQMPEMDGYTAVKKIRSEFPKEKKSIPIMAMTAHATSSEKQKIIDAGMNDYISKPFEPELLKDKILELTKLTSSSFKDQAVGKFTGSFLKTESITYSENNNENTGKDAFQETSASESYIEKISTPKINLTYLKNISEGNDSFVIEMIETFLNKTPLALEEMNEHFLKQNWEEMRKIAHRIKPSFAYIGLKEVQTTLSKIETWSDENGDKNIVSRLMAEVSVNTSNAFDQLRKELLSMK